MTFDEPPEPTAEEILKVRRMECRARGCLWTPIEVMGSYDPVAFTCMHCGRTLDVMRRETWRERRRRELTGG